VNRYFFVENPVEIAIPDAPERVVKFNLHPDHPERGTRTLVGRQKYFITQKDADELKQKNLYRLMECLNFSKTPKGLTFDSQDVETYREKGERIMHWLPAENKQELMNVSVLMPDATTVKGYGEPSLKDVKVNDVIQFERFGFCRLDKKEGNTLSFWFTHK
jgi:glutamyl-tRNA synthetase